MKQSISARIALYFILFAVSIIGVIWFSVRFVLPEYYTERQMKQIQETSARIKASYEEPVPDSIYLDLQELQDAVGGEINEVSENGMVGFAYGKGRNQIFQQKNNERFIPNGKITEYKYENKLGLEVYVLGIQIENGYLVYEVNIQSLDDAVGVILEFVVVLLLFTLLAAVILSLVLSRKIAKPIKALNALAHTMKNKKVQSVMVVNNQDEIGQLNQTLNELYEELLSGIYQLESELKKERNAERLKKRFLAQATHELKTPIAVIRGYAEILYDGMYKNENERDRYIQNIYEETEVISRLIVEVLDYTKMETGNYILERSDVEAKDYFEKIIDRYREFVESKNLQFDVQINIKENFRISIDANRIEQVFKNLISNAVEHGNSKITVIIERIGSRILLKIGNDGPYIDEEDLPYIFDSFYKKKGKKKGTGLGLAIVKEIMLLHKGDCRAENTLNGVEFVVMI